MNRFDNNDDNNKELDTIIEFENITQMVTDQQSPSPNPTYDLNDIDNQISVLSTKSVKPSKHSKITIRNKGINQGFKNKKKNKMVLYCGNCGKSGHTYKNCNDPITSFGMILLLISGDNESDTINQLITSLKSDDTCDSDGPIGTELKIPNEKILTTLGINCENQIGIQTFCNYKDNIKFLMIRRKHTLGYLEFIRGRYTVDNVDGIIFLFRQMTPTEIKKIGSSTFDELWNELWIHNKDKVNYQDEYIKSKQKFERLKADNDTSQNSTIYLGLQFYVNNVQPAWNYPEWGFPKGRRNRYENDLDCALREFKEESGYDGKDYVLLDNIEPLEEVFIGTNGINYKHVYYIGSAISDKNPKIDVNNKNQSNEIGDIGWFTYQEAINLIRPYHTERKKLLTELYMYILNCIIIIKNKC